MEQEEYWLAVANDHFGEIFYSKFAGPFHSYASAEKALAAAERTGRYDLVIVTKKDLR